MSQNEVSICAFEFEKKYKEENTEYDQSFNQDLK